MKWGVIGHLVNRQRFELLNEYIGNAGHPSQLVVMNPSLEEFPAMVKKSMLEFDQLRIESPFRGLVSTVIDKASSQTMHLQCADALLQDRSTWWPRNVLYDSILRICADKFRSLDISSVILIVGAGDSAQVATAALIKLGFSHIRLTARNTEKGEALVAKMKKVFLKTQIEFVAPDMLTLLPGDNQILFNTTPCVTENELLEELYYFNYLKNEGIVVDIGLVPIKPRLLVEAFAVQANVIEGCELAARMDVIWCKMCLGIDLPYESYLVALRAKLSEPDAS